MKFQDRDTTLRDLARAKKIYVLIDKAYKRVPEGWMEALVKGQTKGETFEYEFNEGTQKIYFN